MGVNKINFEYKTDAQNIYKVYLSAINGILKLTNKEILVAAKFYEYLIEVEKGISDKRMQSELLFSPAYKKRIREDLGMSTLLLNNYVSSLKEKKIIQEVDGIKFLNQGLKIDSNAENVLVTFNFQL